MRQWKVYFDGSFWGHHGADHAGREVRLDKQLLWGERLWLVPAIYLCGKGVVMDLAVSADAAETAAFVEKWRRCAEDEALCDQILREHPLRMDVDAALCCGGKMMYQKRASGAVWLPDCCAVPDHQNHPRAEEFLTHYGLDRERAWNLRRIAFPWSTGRRPRRIGEITLHLSEELSDFFGEKFTADTKEIPFVHPITGKVYRLTVLEVQEQELPEEHFRNRDLEYPRNCIALTYTVDPPLEGAEVHWCGEGDVPREKDPKPGRPAVSHAGAVAWIRGGEEGSKTAMSALYFALPEKREWQIVVREKLLADGAWSLMKVDE